jgi:hypothetical protein
MQVRYLCHVTSVPNLGLGCEIMSFSPQFENSSKSGTGLFFWPIRMSYGHIDWDLPEVINPTYIAAVHILIKHNYPQREPKSSKSPYPKEHLGSCSVSFDPWMKNDEEILRRYNPFHLRIPYSLATLQNISKFDHTICLNPYGLDCISHLRRNA